MRPFILKTVIICIATYILFKLTIGQVISDVATKINSISNHSQRIEIKQKILAEIKKGTAKENFFSNEERIILSNFIKKIINELKEPSK